MRGSPTLICERTFLLAIAFFVLTLALGRTAAAYPWMLRHGYTGCATCHVDPSGQGLLTEYGRAQSELVLSTRYGAAPDQEPGRIKDAFFGLPTPDWLTAGGWGRDAYGTLGFATQSSAALSEKAWVTTSTTGPNLVSREHWIGVDLSDETMLLRAGRMNLPFGLRNVEHTSWVRSETRTDVNQAQQHGVALAANGERWRGEVMAILGNFQMNPDSLRERGGAAYVEHVLGEHFTVGLSTKVTHAAADPALVSGVTRQAHGPFVRYAPVKPLVVLAEGDLLVASPSGTGPGVGGVGWLQLDLEPWQGVHFDLAGETLRHADVVGPTGLGAWASIGWFFFPHFDARFDTIVHGAASSPTTVSYLLQMNAYF
jgi:hypothetical protein